MFCSPGSVHTCVQPLGLGSPEHWAGGSGQALHSPSSFPRGKSRQPSHHRQISLLPCGESVKDQWYCFPLQQAEMERISSVWKLSLCTSELTPQHQAPGAQVLQHKPNFSQSQHGTETAYFKSEPAMTLPQQKPCECSTVAHYGLSGAQNTPHHIPSQALH